MSAKRHLKLIQDGTFSTYMFHLLLVYLILLLLFDMYNYFRHVAQHYDYLRTVR